MRKQVASRDPSEDLISIVQDATLPNSALSVGQIESDSLLDLLHKSSRIAILKEGQSLFQ